MRAIQLARAATAALATVDSAAISKPWNPLVLSVGGVSDELVDAALHEPSIRSVYGGLHSTFHSTPQMPHDGYLGEFLMESKGYVGN